MSRAAVPPSSQRWIPFGAAGLCLLATTCSTCVLYEGQKDPLVGAPNDYVGAGVFAATAVGATVAHRELTGGCLAQCSDGWTCNRDTGVCEQTECRCPSGQSCVRDGDLARCVAPVEDPEDDNTARANVTCRKKADCGADQECCFSPAPLSYTACADECAENSLIACAGDGDCAPGMRCIDVDYEVDICAE